MFSFRRSQIRAILRSIVIADALSHQVLPWKTQPTTNYWQSPEGTLTQPLAIAISRDQWCQQITHSMRRHLVDATHHHPATNMPLEAPTEEQGEHPGDGVLAILTTLPMFLQSLDARDRSSWLRLPTGCQIHQEVVTAFYQGAEALLNSDLTLAEAAVDITQKASTHQDFAIQVVVLAFEHVLRADGDFSLTIGQSLQSYPPMPGLPILSSLLSACWRGSQGIPVRWHQALIGPTPALESWLQQRWQMSSINVLDEWAEVLTGLWMGRYPWYSAPHERVSLPAVQPIMESAP